MKIPLEHVLGDDVGRVFESFHREHGVQMYFEELAIRFEGNGRVQRVVTNRGRTLDCDFVVVGVGVEPVTDVVAEAGVNLDNGILVGEYCRTNVEGIYAAGDVARHYPPLVGRYIRVEHFQNAISQGIAAAKNMMGNQESYAEVHRFWSDQYDYNIQYTGFHEDWDEFVVRGSLEKRNFVGFYLKDKRLTSAIAINRAKDLRLSARLIEAKVQVDVSSLTDESVKLKSLIPR